MAVVGEPRDMSRWRDAVLNPTARFPGETEEYRKARNELLDAEEELHRHREQVAAQRSMLPPGGMIPEDYVFEDASDGGEVRMSELFKEGRDSLVIYSMMFPRWPEDMRAAAPCGKTAELPILEQPCPSCTSLVDGLAGVAVHLAERTNLVIIAKAAPERLRDFARERGWDHLRLLSSRRNTYNRDYHAEDEKGVQISVLNVFARLDDGVHHHWASELAFRRGDTSPLEPIWPIFGILELTREGGGDRAAYPNLQY